MQQKGLNRTVALIDIARINACDNNASSFCGIIRRKYLHFTRVEPREPWTSRILRGNQPSEKEVSDLSGNCDCLPRACSLRNETRPRQPSCCLQRTPSNCLPSSPTPHHHSTSCLNSIPEIQCYKTQRNTRGCLPVTNQGRCYRCCHRHRVCWTPATVAVVRCAACFKVSWGALS